jgi:hypothetical protein
MCDLLKMKKNKFRRVILWQVCKIPSFVYMKEKFVTNISFATVHLINHSSDRIHCLVTFYYKKKKCIFFYVFYSRGVGICVSKDCYGRNNSAFRYWFRVLQKIFLMVNNVHCYREQRFISTWGLKCCSRWTEELVLCLVKTSNKGTNAF